MRFTKMKYTQFRERKVPKAPGLYKISINGIVKYVGRAVNLRIRYNQHQQSTEHNPKLFEEMQKNDNKEFEYVIIHEKSRLKDLEKREIKRYGGHLLNRNKGG